MTDAPERISHTPSNPSPGDIVTVSYDFTDLPDSVTEVTLTLTWTQPHQGAPTTLVLTRSNNSCAIATYANTASILITDNSGYSQSHTILFQP